MNTPKGIRQKAGPHPNPPSQGRGRGSRNVRSKLEMPPPRKSVRQNAPTALPAINFFTQVYAVVRMIPKGQVATYGQVAAILENPRAARTVGWALNGLPDAMESEVPWHRVINAQGRISNSGSRHGGAEEQARRLKREGVKFDKTGRCDLRQYLWEPPMNLRLGA